MPSYFLEDRETHRREILTWRERMHRRAKRFLNNENNRDIQSILEMEEGKKYSGQRILNKEIERVLKENGKIHEREQVKHSEANKMIKAPKRAFTLYKNIILLNVLRQHESSETLDNSSYYLMNQLIFSTKNEARKLIQGVFSNCCYGSSFNLNVARDIAQQFDAYVHDGGLDKTTARQPKDKEEGRFPFDGLLQTYFDQRVRGRKTSLNPLHNNKGALFATALALYHIAERFENQPRWYLQGINQEGMELSEPVR